jgi:hypothetical protein
MAALPNTMPPKGWHSRGYLPHFDGGSIPLAGHSFSEILHSWKSYTSNAANRLLGRSGEFWYPDYFDRFIRDERHFLRAVEYIEMNPVAAGLCLRPEDWPYGSARFRRSAGFQPAAKGSAAKMAKLPKDAARMAALLAALRDHNPAGKP